MLLKDLIKGINYKKILGDQNIEINEVKTFSCEIVSSGLFICLKGNNFDGHDYYQEAIKNGAKAIITQKVLDTDVCQIVVEDARIAYSICVANFYSNPQKKIKFIGVTGTNGKTSTTHLIASILNNYGVKCGIIGTLGVYYCDIYKETNLTTPDPIEFFSTLSEMLGYGVEYVAMEISAHANFYKKLYGVEYEVLAFTNLSQDHLDFFENMENYERAKLKVFNENKHKYIVTNVDDEVGKKIAVNYKNTITYGIKNPSDVFAINVKQSKSCTNFIVNLFDKVYSVHSNLIGLFNVYNSLCAVTCCALIGVPLEKVIVGLTSFKGVSGRLENVYDKKFSVFIDYAHTPDGLEKVLKALKPYAKGKIICVFGCGGNRDKTKRKIMGETSGKNSDFVILTTDNPRFEEPMQIIYDIEDGVKNSGVKYVLVEDRKDAIRYALSMAREKDVVLVAGKGSEKYQEVLGVKKPYSDKETINEIIKELNDL